MEQGPEVENDVGLVSEENERTEELLEECRKIIAHNPLKKINIPPTDYRRILKYVLYLKRKHKGKDILVEVKKYYLIKDIQEDLGLSKTVAYKLSRGQGTYKKFFHIEKYVDPRFPVYDE